MLGLLTAGLACMGVLTAPTGDRFTDRSDVWERSERDVLRGFHNMYNPHVIHAPGSEYPFRMWFFGWASEDCNPGYSGCDAICFARGKSLEEWEVWSGEDEWDAAMSPKKWVPVIAAQDEPWDQWHNGDPSVVLYEGTYHMAYSSTGFDLDGIPFHMAGDTDGDICCVMGATSEDGIHWAKSARPILIYEPEIGQPLDPNRPDDAVAGGMYHRPSLMREDGKWRLWFDYWASHELGTCMGYAENEGDFLDPSDWQVVHAGDDPLIVHWPNPDVIKAGERYYCYSDPYVYGNHVWTGRQIAEAISDDGITWEELGFIKPDSDAPANHVPEALVLDQDGEPWIILFYACQNGGEPEYDYRYSRVRYMKRRANQ